MDLHGVTKASQPLTANAKAAAVQLADSVAFPNLVPTTIFFLIFASFALGLGSLHLARFYYTIFRSASEFSHLLLASPWLFILYNLSTIGFLIFAPMAWLQIDSILRWIKWQKNLEVGLEQEPEMMDAYLMATRRHNRAIAEIKNKRFAHRSSESCQLLIESCESLQYGHFYESRVYREPKWLKIVAIQVGEKLVLSAPPSALKDDLLELHKLIVSGQWRDTFVNDKIKAKVATPQDRCFMHR